MHAWSPCSLRYSKITEVSSSVGNKQWNESPWTEKLCLVSAGSACMWLSNHSPLRLLPSCLPPFSWLPVFHSSACNQISSAALFSMHLLKSLNGKVEETQSYSPLLAASPWATWSGSCNLSVNDGDKYLLIFYSYSLESHRFDSYCLQTMWVHTPTKTKLARFSRSQFTSIYIGRFVVWYLLPHPYRWDVFFMKVLILFTVL